MGGAAAPEHGPGWAERLRFVGENLRFWRKRPCGWEVWKVLVGSKVGKLMWFQDDLSLLRGWLSQRSSSK